MSYFDDLHANVARMGRPIELPRVDTTLAPSTLPPLAAELESGIEIALDELENSADLGGLLGYRGSQVLLYIREQGNRIDEIRDKPFIGPKYHVAHCRTLRWMRAENRFGRYVVTNDVSGSFRLVERENRPSREVRADLNVCKNCLQFLNYQGYRTDAQSRRSIFESFGLPTFFSTYSTLFEYLPTGVEMIRSGDSRSWVSRPDVARDSIGECGSCGVRLPLGSSLLGVPSGANRSGGRVVCADCRRKPPISEPVHMSEGDMRVITSARRERPVTEMAWEESYLLADSAFHGLMRVHERQGYDAPEPGVELTDERGAVCVELGLAWSVSRHAVVLHEHEAELARRQGWDALVLEAALLDAQEDG